MDGGAKSTWDTAMSTNWTWDKVSHRGGGDPVVYHLAAGTHTLRIDNREEGTKLDSVVITKNTTSVPSTSVFNGSPSTTTNPTVPSDIFNGSPSNTTNPTVPSDSTSAPSPSNPTGSTVFGELTDDYDSSQTVFAFEAEDGGINDAMVTSGDNNASSGTYIWVPSGGGSGYAQYTFDVTSAGDYIVWGRVLAPNGLSDSFYASMDGGAKSTWDTARSTNWTWDKVSHRGGGDPVVYHLAVGTHTLRIDNREEGTKLDCVVISKNTTSVPSTSIFNGSPSNTTNPTVPSDIFNGSPSNTTNPTVPSDSTSAPSPSNPTGSTVFGELTDDYDSSQTVFAFEAEDGGINDAMVTSGDNNASSGTYIWVPSGGGSGYAQYTFDVTSAGDYIVWGRVLAPDGVSDSFYASMDGGAKSTWDTARSTNWTWDKVSHRGGGDPVVYHLAAGTHTLRIDNREEGTKLDCVVISKNTTSVPSTSIFNGSPFTTSASSGSGSTTISITESVNAEIEAEDGTMSNTMERAADNNASSGMYIWVPTGGDSGGYATFTFDVTQAGKYIIWGRVLAPDGFADSFYVSMDGGADSLWDVTRSTKWVWDMVSHRTGANPVTYTLATGKHTLVIKQREAGTKLDQLIITDDMNLKP